MSNKSKHINRQCTQQCNNRNQCQTSTRKFNAKNKNIRNTYQRAAKIAPRRPKSTQEQPKTASRRPKSHPKTVQRGPKSPQERPKTSPRRPKTPPRALLRRSWGHLGTIKQQDRNQDGSGPIPGNFLGRFWSPKCSPKRPQSESKTSQKSRRKMHHFFIALGPVLDRS